MLLTDEPLIGRGAVLDTVFEQYRRAREGSAGAIIVRGEVGIGKTQLLARAVSLMRRDGCHVVATAVLDYASSPFAPILTVLETWLRERPDLFERSATLRSAIDQVVQNERIAAEPSAAERRRFFDRVAHVFQVAADAAPVTIAIDDLHNADPSTLHLLYHILDALRGRRFFLLASCLAGCDGEAGEQWLRQSRLERLEHVSLLNLAPLDDEATAALIRHAAGGRLPREARARIAAAAEGNPLFAQELVRQAVESGGDARTIPRSLAEAVLDHFRRLSAVQRECLHLAACIGREFNSTVLAVTLQRPASEVHAVLRAARSLGLIDETSDPDVFRFHHALTREAVYGDMLQAERRAAHQRIFATLDAMPHTVDRIPMLALQAHAAGDRRNTVFYNEVAGDQALANRAFESAVGHWLRALAAIADPAHSAAVQRKTAAAWLAAGFPDRAVVPGLDALQYYRRACEAENAVDMLLLLAEAAGQIGDDERRLELMAEVGAEVTHLAGSRYQAKRSLCESEIALADHDVAAAISATSAALRLNLAEIDVGDMLALRNARAHAQLMEGRYHAAIDTQLQAVEMAVERGASEHLFDAHFGFGVICALSGDPLRAADAFGAAAAAAGTRMAMTERALSLAHQAEMRLIAGDVAAARTLLDEALPYAGRRDNPALTVELGRVGLFLGVRTDDAAIVRRIVDVLELDALFGSGTPERYFPLSGAYAQYLASVGRPDDARDVLRRAVRRLSAKRLRSTDWSVCSMMTVAAVGDEADMPRARAQIAGWFAPYAPAFVSLFDALVADRAGDARAAAAMAEGAVTGFHAFGFRYEEGLALALADRNAEALAVFQEFGARPDAARARDALTPRNRQGRPAHELTAREYEVADLAAAGLRNRAISEQLSVSEKTVETHLGAIFAKLGVRSRGEIAERLAALRADAI